MIHGNLEGVRESLIQEMEKLYDIDFDRSMFLPDRLLQLLVRFTDQLNREMLVYLDRNGEILEVAVGSISSIGLTEMHLRRNFDRLTGFRCIHTHPGGNAALSDVDIQALRLLRFDSMCAVGVNGGICTGISAAFLGELEYSRLSVNILGPVKPGRLPQQAWLHEIELSEERVQKAIAEGGIVETAEKVMLISTDSEESLDELASLADTAGAVIVSRVLQKRPKPDPAMFIGAGKAQELSLACQTLEVDLAILDDELTGAQQKNLENALGVRVIDRTSLILDIFARRAETAEGKLQVELAQLKYRLPRLAGSSSALSRLGGGIGTRGPGETKLEVDRRRIRRRITEISRELDEVKRHRDQRRELRERREVPVCAIVGYTNAGKSSLLNLLSGADVLAEDKLFATLDPITRRITLPGGTDCLLVDTVGFISKLPHDLVSAFRSTLEEALHADLLLIVQDVSDENFAEQQQVVQQVLSDLGAGDKPTLHVYNKCDLRPEVRSDREDVVLFSAKEGQGVPELLRAIESKLHAAHHLIEIEIPYTRGDAVSFLHKYGSVQSEDYTAEGTRLTALVDDATEERLRRMLGE